MGKLVFWLVVVFGVMFALRLYNVSQQRRRDGGTDPKPKARDRDAAAMVRCAQCGVYLPRADAKAIPAGFCCGDAKCLAASRDA